jgi:hypothetical protein
MIFEKGCKTARFNNLITKKERAIGLENNNKKNGKT